jgi:hypothetical protein
VKLTFDLSKEGYPWELAIELEGGGLQVFRGTDTPEIPGLMLPVPAPAEEPARGRPSKYDEDFKAKAVALAKEIGTSKAGKELGVPVGTIYKWVKP